MARDRLAELREEWYSESDSKPETDEEIIDDEFLELNILFKSRGVTVSGDKSVTVTKSSDQEQDGEAEKDK